MSIRIDTRMCILIDVRKSIRIDTLMHFRINTHSMVIKIKQTLTHPLLKLILTEIKIDLDMHCKKLESRKIVQKKVCVLGSTVQKYLV